MKNITKPLVTSVLSLLLPLLTAVAATETNLEAPFGSSNAQTEPLLFIAVIIQALLGIVGAGALLMFVWGGFLMIFSGGVEDKIKKGRDTLLWASIGMLIILSSYGILRWLFTLFRAAAS